MNGVAKLATDWWTRPLAQLGRWSPMLAAAWADGLYLTAWPCAAMLLPMLALLVGVGEGATHWSFHTLWDGGTNPSVAVTFVQMLPLLYVAAIAGAFSAQLGLLLVAGFAAGDWMLASPIPQYPRLSGLGHFLQIGLPQLISYGLFFLLAVQPTLAARLLASSLGRRSRPSGAVWFGFMVVVAAALQAVIVYAWTWSAPMIVRPIWMWDWHGNYPPLTIPYFTGSQLWAHPDWNNSRVNPGLPVSAGIAVLARAVLVRWARPSEAVAANAKRLAVILTEADRHPAFTRRMPTWLRAIVSALMVTLLLGGFIATLWLGIAVFAVIAAILIVRTVVLPGMPGWGAWTALVGKIPLLFSWLIVVGIGWLIARLVYLTPGAAVQANQAAGAFGPELVSIILGFVLTALLLPSKQNTPTPTHLVRVQLRTGAAHVAAAVVLLFGLARAKPALAYCADSSCCFDKDNLAVLAITAIILALSSLFLIADIFAIAASEGVFSGLIAEGEIPVVIENLVQDRLLPEEAASIGLDSMEIRVAVEAQSLLNSPLFADIRAAGLAGVEAEAQIGQYFVQTAPELPFSAMTWAEKNGFTMGQDAWSSTEETAQTVLQELHRLNLSGVIGNEAGAEAAKAETQAASEFAQKTWRLMQW